MALTEIEIFSRLAETLRESEQACRDLAILPQKGPAYDRLRKNLRLVEGCCRQASAWREDTRWLPMGLQMAKAHKMAGDWLRGIQQPDGTRRKLAPGEIHPCFQRLAEILAAAHKVCDSLRHAKTGRRGIILPETPNIGRQTNSVLVRPGGLLVPANT